MNTPTQFAEDMMQQQLQNENSRQLAPYRHTYTEPARYIPAIDPTRLPERPAPFRYRDAAPSSRPPKTQLPN
jgi:hypothetical protein